jgi:hypothetical protein
LLSRAFGLSASRKTGRQRLGDAWSKQAKAAPGNIMSVLWPLYVKGKREKKKLVLSGVPRSLLGAIGTIANLRAGNDDRPVPRSILDAIGSAADPRPSADELAAQAEAEARQEVRTETADREARESKALLSRLAEWLRERFRRPD